MDPTRPLDRDLVPPPLMSSSAKRDPVAPPPRSLERTATASRKESIGQGTGAASLATNFEDRSIAPPTTGGLESLSSAAAKSDTALAAPGPAAPQNLSTTSLPANETSDSAPATEPAPNTQPPPEPEEETRPGLGPMIKAKRSKGELAGAFRKAASAASAANAFKPRPGGAGDKLRQQAQTKPSGGPDGITGVVPAPPRPTSRGARATTPEPTPPPKAPQRTSNVPEVRISVPNSSRPTSSQSQPKEAAKAAVKVPEPEPEAKELPKRSVVAGDDAKYLQNLGIDPNLLDNKSVEIGRWLDHFGWVPGEQMQTRSLDDMKVDLDRELNKAQAGGWLARFQEEDERVYAIKRGIDLSMGECDELDNLLTLYSVELSVSGSCFRP